MVQRRRSSRAVSGVQVLQLASASMSSPRTVERVYDGGGSHYSRERVCKAARELGLPMPSEQTTKAAAT
jgi:DNA-binding LacI/PurR family transcriptional regulator